jgi:tetratricopeptide (TPR) repeat protein
VSADRRKLLADADKAARRGRFGKAVDIYRQLSRAAPADLNVRQRLADALDRDGRAAEAAELFAGLADLYWKSGHRSRAVATIRRAIRIRPRSPRLVFRLAAWMLEQGHPADARDQLLAASSLEVNAETAAEALERCVSLGRHFASDADVHDALARLAERAGDAKALASARAAQAIALCRGGRPETAVDVVLTSVEADEDELSALGRLQQLVEIVDAAGEEILMERGGPEGPRAVGAALLAACWHGLHARDERGARVLESITSGLTARQPAALVFASEVLLQLGKPERSLELISMIIEPEGLPKSLRARAARVAGGLVAQLPREPRAAGLSERLGVGVGPSVDEATPGIVAARPAQRAERQQPLETGGGEEAPAGPCPVDVTQAVVEARTLLAHGLAASAADVLGRVDPRWHSSPEVAPLMAELARRRGETAGPASPASPPQVDRSSENRDDDVLVLLENEETGLLSEDVIDSACSPDVEPSDVRDLGRSLGEALATDDVDDDETRYQMAVGLLQMGLDDQAVTLLSQCAEGSERRGEAALELLRLHTQRGASGDALAVGLRALEAVELAADLRAELLAETAALALHEGRADVARTALEELEGLSPDHVALEALRARTAASRN